MLNKHFKVDMKLMRSVFIDRLPPGKGFQGKAEDKSKEHRFLKLVWLAGAYHLPLIIIRWLCDKELFLNLSKESKD